MSTPGRHSVPAISIIIPTFNGAHKILNVLAALERQSVQDFEIIIVVDGSTDNTLDILNNYTGKAITVVTQENKGRSGAKNAGASRASGELIIFFDDDTVPRPDSVQRHLNFHLQNANSIVAGNVPEEEMVEKTDFQNYKAHLTHKWVAHFPSEPICLPENNFFLSAANFSLPKKVFGSLNGFNELLTDAEDNDLASRALSIGIKIYFDKENIAIHNDPITCRKYILRQRQYKAAFEQVLKVNINAAPRNTKISFARRAFYRMFSFRFWVKWIDDNKLLLMPKKFRFRIYDWVIHSLSVVFPKARL